MGIFNDDEKQTMKTGKCEKGERGPPGLSIKGDSGKDGKDAVLPNGIILDTGFVMKADINMGTNIILNGSYPSRPSDYCIRKYVDDNIDREATDIIKQTNASVKGDVQMNNYEILSCGEATNNTDLVTKRYVDNLKLKSDDYLKVDGTTQMVGSINMNNNRITHLTTLDPNDAATKKYVDSHSSSQNTSFEYMSEFLNYNGNPFYLAKQAAKRSDYVLFKQNKI